MKLYKTHKQTYTLRDTYLYIGHICTYKENGKIMTDLVNFYTYIKHMEEYSANAVFVGRKRTISSVLKSNL